MSGLGEGKAVQIVQTRNLFSGMPTTCITQNAQPETFPSAQLKCPQAKIRVNNDEHIQSKLGREKGLRWGAVR